MTDFAIDKEFSDRIPPLTSEEYAELENNIITDGKCNDPLSVWKGFLVDGHNRYEICKKHNIAFSTVEVDCGGDTRQHALLWIDRHQVGRRNISDDQRATIGKRIAVAESARAMAERGRVARVAVRGRNPVKSDLEVNVSSKSGIRDRTRSTVAKKLNVPERKLRKAFTISKKAGGDAAAIDGMVIAGRITLNDAAKLAAVGEKKRKDVIDAVQNGTDVRTAIRAAKKQDYNERIAATKPQPLEGTYRIFYADPPWKYVGLNQADEHGHAEAHYDCLTDEQLISFKPDGKRTVENLADDNAVLFMWVTAPLLERCFPIIEAWGFKYKANFVWDKVDHVMGFYNSVRHEHLLIATKGQCTPDEKKLFDSVQEIKRTEHSKKPEKFYEIIETLYDHGRKLELFARSGREGWDSVGNEVYEQSGMG